jgi:phosphatidylglycerol lysyltransferase
MRETLANQTTQTLPPMDKELQSAARSLTSRAKVLRRVAGPIAALAACALLLALLNGLSRGLDYHGVMQALRATPHRLVWISIVLTAVSYLALVARDLCALSYVGVKVSTPALLLASFCGSALGNAVSFKALTADAVRDRVYGAVGVSPEQTARVMLFINVAFGIGLAAFAALSLMLAGNAIADLLPISITSIRFTGAAVLLAILFALLLRSWRRQALAIGRVSIEMPSLTITLLQLVASAIDLAGRARHCGSCCRAHKSISSASRQFSPRRPRSV